MFFKGAPRSESLCNRRWQKNKRFKRINCWSGQTRFWPRRKGDIMMCVISNKSKNKEIIFFYALAYSFARTTLQRKRILWPITITKKRQFVWKTGIWSGKIKTIFADVQEELQYYHSREGVLFNYLNWLHTIVHTPCGYINNKCLRSFPLILSIEK